jgi:hypothetical protein
VFTYYRDRTVEVTSHAINIHGRVFDLGDLEYVWHREIGPNPEVRGRVARRGALNIGLIVAGILTVLGLIYVATTMFTGAVATVLVPLGIVVVLIALAGPFLEWTLHRLDHSYDAGTSAHEIWAIWRGKEIMLVRVSDETRFGQIYRGIERALEQQPPS